MLSYFLIATAATLATHVWFDRRLLAPSELSRRWRRALRVLLAANVVLLPGALVLALRAPAAWAPRVVPLARAAFVDEGFCLLLCVALATREILWFAAAPVRRLAEGSAPDVDRRRVLLGLRASGAAVFAAAAGVSGFAHAEALELPELRRVPLPIARLPRGLRGLRIAQISDLHVGPTLRGDTVAALVARVNAAAPDVVVITGDLVDGFVDQLAPELTALRELRPPLGCFFVTGNHEYYYRPDEWVEALRGMGVTVLLGEHRVVERGGGRLLLAGVCDERGAEVAGHPHDPEAALAGAPEADARILLAHRPDCAARAASLGFDAQLSGHLHGGQFFPVTALVRATHPYVAGAYDVGAMVLYVSRGAGYWGPSLRSDARQEIALFELVERAT